MKILQLIIFAVAMLQAADVECLRGPSLATLARFARVKGRRGMAEVISTSLTNTGSRFAIRLVKSTFFVNLLMVPTVCCSILRAGS
jgi:hypothetical protein